MRIVKSAVARFTDPGFEVMMVQQNGQLEQSGRLLLNHYRDDQIVSELIGAGEIPWLCEDITNSLDRWPWNDEPTRPGWEHEHFWPYRFRTLHGMLVTLQMFTNCRHVYQFDGRKRCWYVCSRGDEPRESFGLIRQLHDVVVELE